MAGEEEKNNDFYAVLGLKKECTATELKNAYKKLALKWHPDRCSASGNSKFVDEAKKKFQAIQEAYSVLSDANKRFLYDVGVYDSGDDDDENRATGDVHIISVNQVGAFRTTKKKGMGDFLNEMAAMMNQNKSNENRGETFEELQDLFEEMFQSDVGTFSSSCRSETTSMCSTSSSTSFSEPFLSFSNKRSSSEMSLGSVKDDSCQFQGFCVGVGSFSFLLNTLSTSKAPPCVQEVLQKCKVVQAENARKEKGAGGKIPGMAGGNTRDPKRQRKQKISY